MKVLLLFSLLMLSLRSLGQDSLQWNLQYQLQLPEQAAWTSDHLGQLYVYRKDLIKKYAAPEGRQDAKAMLLFEQSLRKFGQISEIDTKNPMKVMLFSEQQQLIYYVDNTLTKQPLELDLSEYGFNYVTHAESSIQPDKIWIYDQDNSKLSLLATQEQQSLLIKNAGGLVNFANVLRILEREGSLYVIDRDKGIFQFDLYGTLINQVELPAYDCIQIEGVNAFLLSNNRLISINLNTAARKEITLPLQQVKRFEIKQNRLILEAEGSVFHYLVELF